MANPGRNREQWLRAAAKAMAPWIKAAAKEQAIEALYPDDSLISVGFAPSTRSKGNEAIGFCMHASAATDSKTRHLFVCPSLDQPIQVLDVLLHEMCHASLPDGTGHKGPFKKLIRELGLEGKATATYAKTGTELYDRLVLLAERLGPYPHVGVKRGGKEKGPSKGQSKWVRLYSPEIEGYSCVVSAVMLKEHGRPQDPLGNEMEEKDDGE